MNDVAKHLLMAAAGIAVAVAPASAAGLDADGRATITAIGDGKTFIGDCTGKTVQLTGNRQTIVLFGTCKSVVSHGNFQHITLDGATSLRITGDGNTVKWKMKPSTVHALGHKNVLTGA